MKFDWKPESKARYFKKAEAAVKEAGYEDILIVDRDKFAAGAKVNVSGVSTLPPL